MCPWIHRPIECFRLEGSSRGHLIHPPAQSQAIFEHVAQDVSSQVLYISRDGDSHNLLGPLTLCITTLLKKTLLLQSHGNFLCCSLWLFPLHPASLRTVWLFPATKKWRVEDSHDILLQPSSLLGKQSWVSSLYYSTLSRLSLSFSYWGPQNSTQYFSLNITSVK